MGSRETVGDKMVTVNIDTSEGCNGEQRTGAVAWGGCGIKGFLKQ